MNLLEAIAFYGVLMCLAPFVSCVALAFMAMSFALAQTTAKPAVVEALKKCATGELSLRAGGR